MVIVKVKQHNIIYEKPTLQDTTINAMPSEETREAQNERVYQFIRDNPNSSMKDVQKGLLTIPINTICWRFKDLREEGKIINSKTDREMRWSVR